MHLIKDCPLRSMAWLIIDQDNKIINSTNEMVELLGFNPNHQYLHDIWQSISQENNFEIVSTANKTLCVCTHMNQSNSKTIICTDITDLKEHLQANEEPIVITRLSMYGTIEATYSLDVNSCCVGQPMMRYIHTDDVQIFCSGLNEATKTNSIAHFQIRLLINNQDESSAVWTNFTVMILEDQKVLCYIQSVKETTPVQLHCTDLFKTSIYSIQSKFWYALEHGMNLLAKNLASTIISLFQMVLWFVWYDPKHDEQLFKHWVQSTKNSKQVDRLCHLVSYFGISQQTTKSWLDFTLDQTSDWLISKSCTVKYLYDHII